MSPRDRSGGLDGVLVVAKPSGPTSHDVVGLVRRLSSTRRVGHGGTLDPFAAGVLPVFLGRATRLVEYHLGHAKRYTATICFGETSTTDDIDGERTPIDGPPISREQVEAGLRALTGPLRQVPPIYSAVQIGGRRAYQMARAGEDVELAPRDVTIHALDMLEWDETDPARPIAVVDVRCTAGTYVRALARDLGAAVGSAAYLGALARTKSGAFDMSVALPLDTLREAAAAGPDGLRSLLLPADAGLESMPSVALTEDEVADAAKGRFVRPDAGVGTVPADTTLRLLGPDGRIVGIGHREGARIAPEKVLLLIGAKAGHA